MVPLRLIVLQASYDKRLSQAQINWKAASLKLVKIRVMGDQVDSELRALKQLLSNEAGSQDIPSAPAGISQQALQSLNKQW